MRITAAILILAGFLVALANYGFTLGRWLGPTILIGMGVVYLLFPREVQQWRAERRTDRYNRREDR